MKLSLSDIFKFNWRYKKYRILIVNTTVSCELYLWDNWKFFLPALDKLLLTSQEQAFIRTYQSYEYENKWLGFGRMKWNEENNIRWTTKYRRDVSKTLPKFFKTEIWAPNWNKVCDTGMPPDIFISLYNYSGIDSVKEGVVVALPESSYKKNFLIIKDIISQLQLCIPNSKVSQAKRDWWGRTALRNNIEDMNPQELKKIINQQ